MTRKIGFFVLLGVLCALVGYQVLQARGVDKVDKQELKTQDNTPAAKGSAVADNGAPRSMPDMIPLGSTEEEVKVEDAAGEPADGEEITALSPEEQLDIRLQAVFEHLNAGVQLTPEEKVLIEEYEAARAGLPGDRTGNPLDNVGGPDGASYYFVDNVGDSATFEWIELRGDPLTTWINAWTTHDDGYSTSRHPMGFNFPFYGVLQDSFRVMCNGNIQFTSTSGTLSNACLPASVISGPAICVYWDDLHLDRGGIPTGVDVVGYRNFGDFTVIEYDSIGLYNVSCPTSFKFEVILFNDGRIKMQYLSIPVPDACDSTQTIGIQSNGTVGSAALTYVCNTTGIQPTDNRAIWFYQFFYDNDFAATHIFSPASYQPPNAVVDVTARFANVGLITQDSPVKYSFNGGPVETATTQVLAQFEADTVTFAAQLTTPATPGIYALTVWSDLATDEARGNDTVRTTIQVGGDDCANAVPLSGFGPDSAQFNNCAMSDDTPGQPCGASGNDIVFSIDVPNGYQLVVGLGTNTITARHTLRWGGACPGDNFIDCSTTETRRMRFVNNSGADDVAYYTVGLTSLTGTCGDFKVAWQLTTCDPHPDPISVPFIDGFEGPTAPVLPDCWGTAQAFPLTAVTSPMWENYVTTPRTGVNCASVLGAAVGNDDWLFSPGITLTNSTTYIVDFWWRAASATVPESLEVMVGMANISSAMTEIAMPLDTLKTTAYVQQFGTFTPASDGVYYFGWHNLTKRSAGRTRIDDVQIYEQGACVAPAVTVADCTAIGTAVMVCTATGGAGGPLEFQWYTGQTCTPGNEINGATSATYATTVSGDYACKAWRVDPDNCSACDWGTATVTPAPPGYDCSSAIALAGEQGTADYSNCGMGDMSPGQECGTAGNNSGEDMVFVMSVPAGNLASIWQSVNSFDSRHSLRWGGDCPGANLVGCLDTPDTAQFVWANTTGQTENVYFVVGGYNNTTACGNFTLQWYNVPPCPDITCTPTFTENGANDGCGVDGTFNTVLCTDVISGTVSATPTVRDIDVFQFTIGDWSDVTVTVDPEFDAIIEIRTDTDGICPDMLAATINDVGRCEIETRTLYSVPAGQVNVYVYAPFIETFGDQAYCLTLACAPGVAPVYNEDFETDAGLWVPTPPTGGWEWGAPTAPDGPPAAHSGLNVWGTVLAGDYPSNACWTLDLDLGLVVNSPTASVHCWIWYDTETNYDGCQFHASVDGGSTWQLVTPEGGYPQDDFTTNACLGTTTDYWGGNSNGWIPVVLPIGQFQGQAPIFRFWFGSDASVTYPGVFIDDVMIFGVSATNDGPPNPVTNLQAQVNGSSVTLTWTDPTLDIFNNPIVVDSIQVWLGEPDTGTQLGTVGPGIQSFVHNNAPDGALTYFVRPYNNGGVGASTSVSAVVGNPAYVQDFETTNGGWVADPATGGWEWGAPTAPDGPAAHGGANVWGTVLAGDYPDDACFNLTLSLGLPVGSPSATVEFWRWYDTEANFDGCNFKVSIDQGATWEVVTPVGGYPGSTNATNTCNPSQPAWTGHAGGAWTYVVIPIGQYDGQTPQFRFTMGSDGSITYPGFYFDDMIIWGLNLCEPDTVTNLTVYRGLAPSTDVHLRWSGDPALQGTYSVYWNSTLDVFPGTWTVLASGLAPAASMEQVDVGAALLPKRFYLVVSECGEAVAASAQVSKPETPIAK